MDSVLDFLDDRTKKAAFEYNLATLHTTTRLELDALRVCIRLLPTRGPEEAASYLESSASPASAQSPAQNFLPHEQIWALLLSKLAQEHDPEILYNIAEICLGNNSIASAQINRRIYDALGLLVSELYRDQREMIKDETELMSQEDHMRKAAAYLGFLKCSFWLPRTYQHLISPSSIGVLSRFIGIDGLDLAAQDALSALFALLRSGGSIVVAYQENPSKSWSKYESTLGRLVLNGSIVDQTFWNEIKALGPEFFTSNSNHIFRTWFQWISQIVVDGTDLKCVEDDLYWGRLQLGLLKGFADQRKYCLAIIRLSLLAARRDILTPTLEFSFVDRESYLTAYEQFSVLFETIVLDRYSNQVQACLPELTMLLGSGSKISSTMATTLLAAALDSKVQEGIRKIIGNWYINYVVENKGNCSNHIKFLIDGLLPWATEGNLFTSSLSSTRTMTVCTHGSAIVGVIARFVTDSPDDLPPPVPIKVDTSETRAVRSCRQVVILGVIRFILNAGGRIFQPAILYLMEGLIKGLQACLRGVPWQESLIPAEIPQIFRLSRLTGLPEISSDLQSIYCRQLCDLVAPDWRISGLSGCNLLNDKILELEKFTGETMESSPSIRTTSDITSSLKIFLEQLDASKHRSIQGEAYAPASKNLVNLLNQANVVTIDHDDLHAVLTAFWDEAERREFGRSVAIHLPPLLFHPACIQTCVAQSIQPQVESHDSLKGLLSRAIERLQALAKGRAYILSVLAKSLRTAVLYSPSALLILPFEDFIIDFLNGPPSIRSEFLFELAAAEKLQELLPHRTYSSYYGQREWHAYAALIDLIRRFPQEQLEVAKRMLKRLLEPWKVQQAPILIKSKWKDTLQLQAMLLFSDFCITEPEANDYLESFMHALVLEPWPRYRFLLEWIVARIIIRFPGHASRILTGLGSLDDSSPIKIASLMKLGLLVAPFESEDFTVELATHLNYYSASPKVQIRHEANFAFPMVFDLAEEKDWASVTSNPAFVTLNAFIRRLDKFNTSPWTIRTLKLDAVHDFTLDKIFQGQYLSIESPETEKVAYEDFVLLQEEDQKFRTNTPPEHIRLDTRKNTPAVDVAPTTKASLPSTNGETSSVNPAFLQTKSGFDLSALHPFNGPPSMQNSRPASIILVASLIDNPTNLGGLSRISESFGLEALYIDDVKKTGHKDFKATSVTSEKHLPIKELKIPAVPNFLLEAKRNGYEVVGIEQTDRSRILGVGGSDISGNERSTDVGTLPKKCVLVLGSEKGGISPEVLATVDRCVEIKTVGVTRSLNVQTAGGIAVYEWWREWGENQ